MEVYLQNRTTGDYFEATGKWTPLQSQGLNFAAFETALNFARACGMTDIQLVVIFVSYRQKFVLPVYEEAALPDER